jgi:hypothetical protein
MQLVAAEKVESREIARECADRIGESDRLPVDPAFPKAKGMGRRKTRK